VDLRTPTVIVRISVSSHSNSHVSISRLLRLPLTLPKSLFLALARLLTCSGLLAFTRLLPVFSSLRLPLALPLPLPGLSRLLSILARLLSGLITLRLLR
jgi:hypothetical protein